MSGARAGKDAAGRFASGNRFGRGNPHAKAMADARAAIYEAVSEKDLAGVFKALVAKAKEGDVPAARLVVEYRAGKPLDLEVQERIARLEELLEDVLGPGVRAVANGG